MKKTILIGVLMLLMASMLPLAMAEEHLEEDEEREIRAMDNMHGAKTRFLQLERAIMLNVEKGLRVLGFIEETYPEADTSEMEGLLNDLEDLAERVAGTEIEGKTHEELATEYVALRREANSIIQEFRRLARSIISEERLAEARERAEQARTQASERLEAIRERIREEVHAYNSELVRQALERIGVESERIQERIRDREITRAEAEAIVRETLEEYDLEERRIAAEQLSEQLREMAERRAAAAEQARQEYHERQEALRREITSVAEESVVERTREALVERIRPETTTPVRTEFNVWFSDGYLYFQGSIDKPTPCHELTVSTTATRSIPPQVRTDVRMTMPRGEACAQVVTSERIEGRINTGIKPDMYMVYVNNQGLYRTADIPDRSTDAERPPETTDTAERPEEDRPTTTEITIEGER